MPSHSWFPERLCWPIQNALIPSERSFWCNHIAELSIITLTDHSIQQNIIIIPTITAHQIAIQLGKPRKRKHLLISVSSLQLFHSNPSNFRLLPDINSNSSRFPLTINRIPTCQIARFQPILVATVQAQSPPNKSLHSNTV